MNSLQGNDGIPFELSQLQREKPDYAHAHPKPSFQQQMKKDFITAPA